MKAIILAAGYGQRMRPLTLTCPKPLARIYDKPLIEYHLEALSRAGVKEVFINVSHLASKIIEALGSGQQFGLKIIYSEEDSPLGWGGGIMQVIQSFDDQPFFAVSADLWTDYDFSKLRSIDNNYTHLVLVPKPSSRDQGDFGLSDGLVRLVPQDYQYSGIGLIDPRIFCKFSPGYLNFRDVLEPAIRRGLVSGEVFRGRFANVGTMAELSRLNQIV